MNPDKQECGGTYVAMNQPFLQGYVAARTGERVRARRDPIVYSPPAVVPAPMDSSFSGPGIVLGEIDMPRKGKTLEQLIALVERLLVPEGGTVTSPAYLIDKVTSQQREVDIAIRQKVGTSSILVIVECRDRQHGEDVTWIEQLAQKRNDVNADKAVAVSSSGFTQPAIKKAAFYNIEIRKLDSITTADVQSWFTAGPVEGVSENAHILGVTIQIQDAGHLLLSDQLREQLDNVSRGDIDQKFLRSKLDNQLCSIREIWMTQSNLLPIFRGVPEDGAKIHRRIEIHFPETNNRYTISNNNEVLDVINLIFTVDLSIDRTEVPVKRVHSYSGMEGALVQTVEYEANGSVFSVHRDSQSGNRYLTFRPAESCNENKDS